MCPLCIEVLDATERSYYPCPCGCACVPSTMPLSGVGHGPLRVPNLCVEHNHQADAQHTLLRKCRPVGLGALHIFKGRLQRRLLLATAAVHAVRH